MQAPVVPKIAEIPPPPVAPAPLIKQQKHLRKISRSQLRAYAIGMIKSKQNGLCPLCKQPISLTTKGHASAYVVDHDHGTGEIRGVLHRGCNGAEGKVANAVGRWTGLGMDYNKIIPWLRNLADYLEQDGCGIMYPDHKTDEEKADAARAKRNKAAAMKRARERMAKERKEGA